MFDYALIDKSIQDVGSDFDGLVAECGGKVIALDLKDSQHTYRHNREKLITAFSHILE